MVQDGIAPDHVEGMRRNFGLLHGRTYKARGVFDTADFSFLLGQLDGLGGNINAGYEGAEFCEKNGILAIAAADVEHVLTAKVSQDAESELFPESPAWRGRSIALDRQRVDGVKNLCLSFGLAVEKRSLEFPGGSHACRCCSLELGAWSLELGAWSIKNTSPVRILVRCQKFGAREGLKLSIQRGLTS